MTCNNICCVLSFYSERNIFAVKGCVTRALELLFYQINNNLMTKKIGIEPLRRFLFCLGDSSSDKTTALRN